MDDVIRGRKAGLVRLAVAFGALGALALLALHSEKPFFYAAEEAVYSLLFAEGSNVFASKNEALTGEGNAISFAVEGYEPLAGGWGTLAPQGRFANLTPISGLASLTISFLGEGAPLSLTYGWSASDLGDAALLSSAGPCSNFDGAGPAYFALENISEEGVAIVSVSVCYSCRRVGGPTEKIGSVTYEKASDRLSYAAVSYDGSSAAVSLPSEITGIPVTKVASGFANGYGSRMSSFSFPSSIVSFGSRALYGASLLKSLDLSAVAALGEYGFANCAALSSVQLGDDLRSIPAYCFENCSKLGSIYIPSGVNAVGHWAFYGCKALSIRCGAPARPNGWDSAWNPGNRPVAWGLTS